PNLLRPRAVVVEKMAERSHRKVCCVSGDVENELKPTIVTDAPSIKPQAMRHICLAVSSHSRVAQRSPRSDSVDNLQRPPFFRFTWISVPPEISREINSLK